MHLSKFNWNTRNYLFMRIIVSYLLIEQILLKNSYLFFFIQDRWIFAVLLEVCELVPGMEMELIDFVARNWSSYRKATNEKKMIIGTLQITRNVFLPPKTPLLSIYIQSFVCFPSKFVYCLQIYKKDLNHSINWFID